MAEEEEKKGGSKGSGFGKLVFGVVAGNGYDTTDMEFEEALEIFNKLGGENNWKAKELKLKDKEDREKAKRSGGKAEETSSNEMHGEERLNDLQERNIINKEQADVLKDWSKKQNVDIEDLAYDFQSQVEYDGVDPKEAMTNIATKLGEKENSKNAEESSSNKTKSNVPEGFNWNEETNSYEYGGADIMKSATMDGYFEVNINGDDIIVNSLDDAKITIDDINSYYKSDDYKQNGDFEHDEDKYIHYNDSGFYNEAKAQIREKTGYKATDSDIDDFVDASTGKDREELLKQVVEKGAKKYEGYGGSKTDLDEWYEEGTITERQKTRIEKYAKKFGEDSDNIIASMKKYIDRGWQTGDALEETLDDLVAEEGYFKVQREKTQKKIGQLNKAIDQENERRKKMYEQDRKAMKSFKKSFPNEEEILKLKDQIGKTGKATTKNETVAKMYEANMNPNFNFKVKKLENGEFEITSTKKKK